MPVKLPLIQQRSFLLLATLLAGCSNLSEFEHELMGNEAKAWKLCKMASRGRVYSAPPYGESKDQHILFSWNIDDAEREGGPLFCRTNGDGTKLLEFQMSKAAQT